MMSSNISIQSGHLTSSPDSSPSPGMMSSNISIQSGHLSSPQQQTVTQIQLQQQQQQQQQQQDPTKSVQWQITTSSAASQQHNINNKDNFNYINNQPSSGSRGLISTASS